MLVSRSSSLGALAGVVIAVGLLWITRDSPSWGARELEPHELEPTPLEPTPEVQTDPLRGLWTRYDSSSEGAPLRFWYFHGDGHGLYRYGRVGLANSHSFDYAIAGDMLELTFRKSGEQHRDLFELERDDRGQTWLRMADDPREPGARYRRVDSAPDLEQAAAQWGARPLDRAGLGNRLWIDYRSYATGGAGFAMYQLGHTQIDGRGIGWFHRGDFDEWTTESLTYRIAREELELFFDLAEQPYSTRHRVVDGPEGRSLELDVDPRDFWAAHRYRDGGKSFGSHAFAPVVGFELLTGQ